MGLFGNLQTMTLEELLRWVQAGTKTGTLEVERDKIRKRIMFQNGRVVACSSDDPATLIGQFLLARGSITEGTLRDALARQQGSPKNLGEILTEMGAITPEDRDCFVEAKIEETIYGLFDWNEAVFRFEEEAEPDPYAVDADLDVQTILDRGRQRHQQREQSQEMLDDPAIVLRRVEGVEPPELSGNRTAARVFELIDGKRSIADILLHSHAPEFLVGKFLTALLTGGIVEVVSMREPSAPTEPIEETPVVDVVPETPGPADAPGVECPEWRFGETESQPGSEAPEPAEAPAVRSDVNVALALMSSGQPEAALELLNDMLESFPSDGALRHLVDSAEQEFRASMIAEELALTRVPVPRPDGAHPMTPEETFLHGLIDGENDIRAILWLAPMREIEALRTLRGMLRRGLIEVRDSAVA